MNPIEFTSDSDIDMHTASIQSYASRPLEKRRSSLAAAPTWILPQSRNTNITYIGRDHIIRSRVHVPCCLRYFEFYMSWKSRHGP